ncbi:MAG: hypothetical protein U1E42_05735 [Rhodospirillales bacterium]
MTVHRYPPRAGVADLARAGVGTALATGPLVALPLGGWLTALFIALVALFVCYGATGLGRFFASVETDNDGVRTTGAWRQRRTIAWERLRSLRLTYHSTRFDGGGGWMTLRLAGDDRVSFDSRLDGFTDIVRRATAVATRRHLPLDAPTRGNLRALGIAVPDWAVPEPTAPDPAVPDLPASRPAMSEREVAGS